MSFMQSYFPANQAQACTAVQSYSASDATMLLFFAEVCEDSVRPFLQAVSWMAF